MLPGQYAILISRKIAKTTATTVAVVSVLLIYQTLKFTEVSPWGSTPKV